MNSNFRIVFFTAVGITICSFCTSLYLAAQLHLSREQAQIFDTCNKLSTGGSLTVFGLLTRRKLLE
jgi:hypothetical protein